MPSSHLPPAKDFTLELFCRVDDRLLDVPKPALAHLYPREVVTLGLLYSLRGGGWRSFYRWVCKELKSLFPRLPEQSRLFRLWEKYHYLAVRFQASATTLGVCDTLGIELLHPQREGRCWWHFAKKGKSNQRWIVGAKFFVLLNNLGQIVRWNHCPANLPDSVFYCVIEDFEQEMIVLADQGFHARKGDPSNLKICQRGTWNERMLVETVFSLLTGSLGLKKLAHRLSHTLRARLAYTAAVFNLCTNWNGSVCLSLINFVL